jgi:hypothetical protein
MKGFCVICVVMLVWVSAASAKEPASAKKSAYVAGTVVQIQKNQPQSNYVGSSPSDAPLESNAFEYEVSVRVNCDTYIGRYQSEFDYLPAVFTPNRAVEVRLQKHVMYVDVPGDQEYRMGIISRPRAAAANCSTAQ